MVQGDNAWLWLASSRRRKTCEEIPGSPQTRRCEGSERADANTPRLTSTAIDRGRHPQRFPARTSKASPPAKGAGNAGRAEEKLLDGLDAPMAIGETRMMPARPRPHSRSRSSPRDASAVAAQPEEEKETGTKDQWMTGRIVKATGNWKESAVSRGHTAGWRRTVCRAIAAETPWPAAILAADCEDMSASALSKDRASFVPAFTIQSNT